MELTPDQRSMLEGGQGEAVQRCMRLLFRLGCIYGAGSMVPVESVQVSGVSYKSIGDPGLEFLEDFSAKGARVRVPTTLNPAGMDLVDWERLGFDRGFARKQLRIIDAYEAMGISPTVTCTPYLLPDLEVPGPGDHLAWAESSAVSFANSVLGARTNREGGPSSLAAAVCGCTPMHGLHLKSNRLPALVVGVETELKTSADFGALGWWTGRTAQDRIPYFTGIGRATRDQLKGLGAAMAASGAVAMYHIQGITPEADQPTDGLEFHRFGTRELEQAYGRLSSGGKPEVLMFGCPHASLEEIEMIAGLVSGRRLRVPLWVCTARAIRKLAVERGLARTIEQAGGRILADTCMVVSPIEELDFETVAVDSGKSACYLPGFCKKAVVYGSLPSLVEEAMEAME